MPWEEALTAWLDGNVISRDSARYVAHFLSVLRVRPRDDVEDVRSDEDADDEQFILATAALKRVLANAYRWTRVGIFSDQHPG